MNTHNPRNTLRTAFTLIEMLIVIAIIAILASLLLVAGSLALKFKAKVVTEHQINGLHAALEFYFPHIRNFQNNWAGAFDLPDYVQMLGPERFEEKKGNLLLVTNGSWGPADSKTASHIKDGFGRPIWIQIVNRETPKIKDSFYTAVIAIRSYGANDDPDFYDDIIDRYDTERLVWEKCRMSGYNDIEWILAPKK
jgi:prepilin-type N-terminal cleavage/methylation domain-containing protein